MLMSRAAPHLIHRPIPVLPFSRASGFTHFSERREKCGDARFSFSRIAGEGAPCVSKGRMRAPMKQRSVHAELLSAHPRGDPDLAEAVVGPRSQLSSFTAFLGPRFSRGRAENDLPGCSASANVARHKGPSSALRSREGHLLPPRREKEARTTVATSSTLAHDMCASRSPWWERWALAHPTPQPKAMCECHSFQRGEGWRLR